jgi:hypothetical protein
MSNSFQLNNITRKKNSYKLYLNKKKDEMNKYLFVPTNKILILVACHTNTKLKFETIKKTIQFLSFDNATISVANTKELEFNEDMNEYCKNKNISYHETENYKTYDFGKWLYLLNNLDYSSYESIFFINDSFIVLSPIHFFIHLSIKSNVELYGYNDSTQCAYHYQSYLFSIKKNAIPKFINMIHEKIPIIQNQQDVINEYELKMIHYFTHDCFLKIGNIPFHKEQNIFFTSDYLYTILLNMKLLPFVKIKRIT